MTTVQQPIFANAVAGHSQVERFAVYAQPELAACPYWRPGICFQPECGKPFEPARDWQMFCCKACENAARNEYRNWGLKFALPMLLHRQDKYQTDDQLILARTRAARRYATHLQSEWLADRQKRAGENHDKY